MASDIKTKIAIEGEQEYRRAIKSITQADKELDSELKLLASSFDKNSTAQQKAAAKIPILTKQIENQKNKLATLTDLLAKQQKQYQDYDFNPRSPCGERQQRCTNTASVCCAIRHILQKICSSLIILLHLQ